MKEKSHESSRRAKKLPRETSRGGGDILFWNSAILLGIGEGIMEYFTKVARPQNELQRAFINAWANCPHIHLRCLGILHKCFSGPWMAVIGSKESILELNDVYQEVYSRLHEWQEDPRKMLDGHTAFGEVINDDAQWRNLKDITEKDTPEVNRVLSLLVGGLKEVMTRQLGSQLPGGEFWGPSEKLRQESRSCSTTNISGERNFALLDSKIYRAPNATLPKLEGKIMFQVNKTRQWLESKPKESRSKVINEAIPTGRKVHRGQ